MQHFFRLFPESDAGTPPEDARILDPFLIGGGNEITDNPVAQVPTTVNVQRLAFHLPHPPTGLTTYWVEGHRNLSPTGSGAVWTGSPIVIQNESFSWEGVNDANRLDDGVCGLQGHVNGSSQVWANGTIGYDAGGACIIPVVAGLSGVSAGATDIRMNGIGGPNPAGSGGYGSAPFAIAGTLHSLCVSFWGTKFTPWTVEALADFGSTGLQVITMGTGTAFPMVFRDSSHNIPISAGTRVSVAIRHTAASTKAFRAHVWMLFTPS